MGDLTIRLLNGRDEFDALAPRWDALLGKSGSDTPFLAREWIDACRRHLAGEREPLVYLLESGGAPVGIAPLARRRVGGWRIVEFLGGEHADYRDLILCPEHRAAGVRLLFETLRRRGPGWDAIDLRGIPEESPNRAALEAEAARGGGGEPNRGVHDVAPVLPLKGSWADYEARLDRKMRKDTDRQVRRLERIGGLRTTRARTPAALDRLLRVFHEQKGSRAYRGRVAVDPLGSASGRAFLREVTHRGLERGWLDARALELTGEAEPLAVSISFRYHGRYLYWLPSIGARHARCSPGRILLGRLLREAFERGDAEFDFLRGPEAYKYRWLAEERRLYRVTLYRPGPRGGTLRAWREALRPRLRSSAWLTRVVRETRRIARGA